MKWKCEVRSAKCEPGLWRGMLRSADFQVCCIAGFQTCGAFDVARAADLEIGDTAGLETCATPHGPRDASVTAVR
jgi:hypothetical protein